jgi:hypothetical protein
MEGRNTWRLRGNPRAPILLSLSLIACGVSLAAPAWADDEIEHVLAESGKVRYAQYCTPCHGGGGAPGKAAVDLRTYVARHGGKFPAADWLSIIADTRPGSVHADVWERIRRDQTGSADESVVARGIVGQIARYVNSIQSKAP